MMWGRRQKFSLVGLDQEMERLGEGGGREI